MEVWFFWESVLGPIIISIFLNHSDFEYSVIIFADDTKLRGNLKEAKSKIIFVNQINILSGAKKMSDKKKKKKEGIT